MGGVLNARRLFPKELVKKLIMPHMRRRLECTLHLQKHIIQAMEMCGLERQGRAGSHRSHTAKYEEEMLPVSLWARQESVCLLLPMCTACVQRTQIHSGDLREVQVVQM